MNELHKQIIQYLIGVVGLMIVSFRTSDNGFYLIPFSVVVYCLWRNKYEEKKE